MMSTLLKKRYSVLSFLFIILSSLEYCDVLGEVNSAAEVDPLLGEGAVKHSEGNFVSRERKSVDDGTKAGSLEAQLLNGSTPVNSSIAPSSSRVLNTTAITRAIGSADGSRNLSTASATVGPTYPSTKVNVTSTPEIAATTEQATSPASTPAPATTIVVSTKQSTPSTVGTQNVIPTDVLVRSRTTTTSIDETTEEDADNGGNVRGQEDPREEKRQTLFGFVTVEILIALLAGAACAVILVAFLVYRIKKRSEGSYELRETVNYSKKTYSGKDSEKEVFV